MTPTRILSSIALGLSIATLGAAQPDRTNRKTEGKPVDAETARAALRRLSTKQGKARTLRATYRQERTTILLKKPLVSHGVLALRKAPACLVFRTKSASGTIVRVKAGAHEVYRPKRNTLERTLFESPALAEALFRSFDPDPVRIEKSFRLLSAKQRRDRLTVTFGPKSTASLRYFRSFSVTIDAKQSALVSIGYTDGQGDRVDLKLSSLELNPKLEAEKAKELFDFEVPESTKVVTHRVRKPKPERGR